MSTWQPRGERTLSVRTTYVTYDTVDTRNRSSLDVACVPRSYTVSVTCVLSDHATFYLSVKKKNAAHVASKTRADK